MKDRKYLRLLSEEYPNSKAAAAEIINIRAILALPKGSEYFFSDLHGEYEAFRHMIQSASGVIMSKINEIYGAELSEKERKDIAYLIYNAKAEIERRKTTEGDMDRWMKKAIINLVVIAKAVSTKYTRSKVRRKLPEHFAYSMDELLHADEDINKKHYYNQIVSAVIDCGFGEEYIIEMADLISRLAIDHLHIIGDIYDRGSHPDKIMDYLMQCHNIDIQWGNHDVVWMGAATGNWPCISNVLRMNISYNNFDMLEVGYGINLRPLASFANEVYKDDPCEYFMPHLINENKYDPVDPMLAAKMHKAIAICQFKIEGQRIQIHPEYNLKNRRLLDKIDYEKGEIEIRGKTYPLRDTNFPTIDPKNPYELTGDEERLMNILEASFLNNEKLQTHIKFLYSNGSIYKKVNGNLLYHGCIPLTDEGKLKTCKLGDFVGKGREYMDYLDKMVRKAYFNPIDKNGRDADIMWYLWLGKQSPLFGKDQMTTFERYFIEDKKTHKEHTLAYYKKIDNKEVCENILRDFGLKSEHSKILSGHVPVKIKDGESPERGEGRLYIIDGGISKAYQKQTGIAGYTFIFNSRMMALAEHKPYSPLKKDGTQTFTSPRVMVVDEMKRRLTIEDTDIGKQLRSKLENLKKLLKAYRRGYFKESNEKIRLS